MPDHSGTYLHLQRLSTEDGPGIRTTVFMKGCLLRCAWCHNPESLSSIPQVQRVETNCIQCGACLQICPQGCLQPDKDAFVNLDRTHCDACGECVQACPSGALEMLGCAIRVDELFTELIKDQNFFRASQGGVTLSGGEPALQADFCAALLTRLQGAGIHTALDTCGMTSWSNLEKILPHVDLVLYDLKVIDPEQHTEFTGQSNEVILRNLIAVSDFIREQRSDTRIWIRTPLIPGATATRANLQGIGRFLTEHLDGFVERWELCAFNNLCRDKYRRLGLEWAYEHTSLLTPEELSQLLDWAVGSDFSKDRLYATGATGVEGPIFAHSH